MAAMPTFDALSRYGTGVAVKVAMLAAATLVLRLLVLPLAVATLLVDRAAKSLDEMAARMPVATCPLTVPGGAR